MLLGMYSSLASPTSLLTDDWSSYDLAMWEQAGLELRNALESAESAAAVAAPLPEETDWQARGMQALHEAIAEQNALLILEVMVLQSLVADWRAVGVA